MTLLHIQLFFLNEPNNHHYLLTSLSKAASVIQAVFWTQIEALFIHLFILLYNAKQTHIIAAV